MVETSEVRVPVAGLMKRNRPTRHDWMAFTFAILLTIIAVGGALVLDKMGYPKERHVHKTLSDHQRQ